MNRWRALAWGLATALVALPAVAMALGSEGVHWTPLDFLFAIVLIGGTGLVIEAGLRLSSDNRYRAGFALAMVTSLLLVWVNAAVGFLGSEQNGYNLAFGAVIAVWALGAMLCWRSAARMSQVLLATAAAQLLVSTVGYLGGFAEPGQQGLYEATMGTAVFTALWLAAAGLFHAAARREGARA